MFVHYKYPDTILSGTVLEHPWQVVAQAGYGSGETTWLALGKKYRGILIMNVPLEGN